MSSSQTKYNQLSLFDKYCVQLIVQYPTLYRTKREVMKQLFIKREMEASYKEYILQNNDFDKFRCYAEKGDERDSSKVEQINMTFRLLDSENVDMKELEQNMKDIFEIDMYPTNVRDNVFELIKDVDSDEENIEKFDIKKWHEDDEEEEIIFRRNIKKEKEDSDKRFVKEVLENDIVLFNHFPGLEKSFFDARNEYYDYLSKHELFKDYQEELHQRHMTYIDTMIAKKPVREIMIQFHDNDFWRYLEKAGEVMLSEEIFSYELSPELKKENILKTVNRLFPAMYELIRPESDWDKYDEYLKISGVDRILFDDEITDDILKYGDNGESVILNLQDKTVTIV